MKNVIKTAVINRMIIASISILLGCFVFLGPLHLLGTAMVSFHDGANSYPVIMGKDNLSISQVFTPKGWTLKKIGFLVDTAGDNGEIVCNGEVAITKANGEVVFSKEFTEKELILGSYTYIDCNTKVDRGKKYCLTVKFDESDALPSVCCADLSEKIAENEWLVKAGEITEAEQMVVSYTYSDMLPQMTIYKSIILIVLLGIVIGLPKIENKWLDRVCKWGIFVAVPFVLGARLEEAVLVPGRLLPFAKYCNLALMLLFEVIILIISHSVGLSSVVASIVITVIYSIDFFVEKYRGQPVRLADFSGAKTAAKVISNYSFVPSRILGIAWLMALILVVLACKTKLWDREYKKLNSGIGYAITLGIGIITMAVSTRVIVFSDLFDRVGFFDEPGFCENLNYEFDGFLVASCLNIRNSQISEPIGYTRDRVYEILSDYQSDYSKPENSKKPNIILIMNESFSDLRVWGNIGLSEENLSFWNSLSDNTIRGYVNASVLGGGTANSEFEVFTGCTNGFLPVDYYPYQKAIVDETPNMVSMLNDMGYSTYSIHPETSINWSRLGVYSKLGFGKSYWIDDFEKDSERIHSGISDSATYDKVISIFEEKKTADEPIFVFDLTMQNHGGYSEADLPLTVTAEGSTIEPDVYLSLINQSDLAFERLINYFSTYDEDVIICMYGDHQPSFEDSSFYDYVISRSDEQEEIERVFNIYKTPFVIWANYDIDESSDWDISMNYLGVKLMQTAGLAMSPFFNYLSQCMESNPIITVNGFSDAKGELHSWEKDDNNFNEYRILQYNLLFGDRAEEMFSIR